MNFAKGCYEPRHPGAVECWGMSTACELPNVLSVYSPEEVFSRSQMLKSAEERAQGGRNFETSKQRAEREMREGRDLLAQSMATWPDSISMLRTATLAGAATTRVDADRGPPSLNQVLSSTFPRVGSSKSQRCFTVAGAMKHPAALGTNYAWSKGSRLSDTASLPNLNATSSGHVDLGGPYVFEFNKGRYESRFVSRLATRTTNGGFFAGSTLSAPKVNSRA